MLIEYNPFGTNTQSLYVYFKTDAAVKVSYTIHVKDDGISDFSRDVYQDEEYQTEHEFQVIGLIPDTENTIYLLCDKRRWVYQYKGNRIRNGKPVRRGKGTA